MAENGVYVMKKILLLIGVLTFTSVANAQEVIGYYEGKPYTQVVQCTCKEVMLVGTTLYVSVPRNQQGGMGNRVGDYAKNRTTSAIENTINHSINRAIWKLQNQIMWW
jgi:hypothetical protein